MFEVKDDSLPMADNPEIYDGSRLFSAQSDGQRNHFLFGQQKAGDLTPSKTVILLIFRCFSRNPTPALFRRATGIGRCERAMDTWTQTDTHFRPPTPGSRPARLGPAFGTVVRKRLHESPELVWKEAAADFDRLLTTVSCVFLPVFGPNDASDPPTDPNTRDPPEGQRDGAPRQADQDKPDRLVDTQGP